MSKQRRLPVPSRAADAPHVKSCECFPEILRSPHQSDHQRA
jgi:hypothetical protein